MGRPADPTDAEAVAALTAEVPLARYCVIDGTVRSWVRLRGPDGGAWVPLATIIEDNRLARVAAGALLRAGARAFRSGDEAAAWARARGGPD